MITKVDKNANRKVRHKRVRKNLSGTATKPRFNVYRSLSHIYIQIIDDVAGHTLVSASTIEKTVAKRVKGMTKQQAAKAVGAEAAKKALAAGIKTVVFDRGGYIYTGRIRQVAEGAREAGLSF